MGITQKRKYRVWSEEEQQELLALLNSENSVDGIAGKLNRSRWAVYAHIRRLRTIDISGELYSAGYVAELDQSQIAARVIDA